MVKLLVKANALVDKANQKGTTALMRATQEGNEEVVGILVSAGADVSKRNNERMNALMLGSQVRRMITIVRSCRCWSCSTRQREPQLKWSNFGGKATGSLGVHVQKRALDWIVVCRIHRDVDQM